MGEYSIRIMVVTFQAVTYQETAHTLGCKGLCPLNIYEQCTIFALLNFLSPVSCTGDRPLAIQLQQLVNTLS